jgi:hypothetical protein
VKAFKILSIAISVASVALAGDVPAVPEIGVDGPSIVSAIGVVGGGLLILRARRNKK